MDGWQCYGQGRRRSRLRIVLNFRNESSSVLKVCVDHSDEMTVSPRRRNVQDLSQEFASATLPTLCSHGGNLITTSNLSLHIHDVRGWDGYSSQVVIVYGILLKPLMLYVLYPCMK